MLHNTKDRTKIRGNTNRFSAIGKYNTKLGKRVSLISAILCAFLLVIVSANSIFAAEKQDILLPASSSNFESNKSALDLEEIVTNNSRVLTTKEKALMEQEIPYPITYKENASLPKDEQKIIQKGANGKQKVSLVRTYENQKLVEETTVNTIIIQIPVEEIVEVGTSDFLNQLKVHLGDTLYVLADTSLREKPDSSSAELSKVRRFSDLKILGVSGQWCRVLFGTTEGYIESKLLTSPNTTPGIDDQNRRQKILMKVHFDMELNAPSGLTLNDFKRIFSGLPQDKNKIIEQNAQNFYEAEQKYKVNGIFLASVAIHESNWGNSNIANDKKNLFGYGAYDNDAYASAYTFGDYKEGIDLVAKIFAKNYINAAGTKIYDDEIAQAKYYNGPTVSGINVRYCTDANWAQKVFSYMELLYAKL